MLNAIRCIFWTTIIISYRKWGNNKSTIYFGSKEDTIFHWECWMARNIERYYEEAGDGCSYDNWSKAKIKVKTKRSKR